MLDAILYIQYSIHILSVLANGFALYCLEKRGYACTVRYVGVSREYARKIASTSNSQELLLKNLASIEMVKMLYDMFPLAAYHFLTSWYEKYYLYFEIVEVILMTIFFEAFILILSDKLWIVIAPLNRRAVTGKFIKTIIVVSWFLGLIMGPLIRLFQVLSGKHQELYYYFIFDIIITLLSGIFFYIIKPQ